MGASFLCSNANGNIAKIPRSNDLYLGFSALFANLKVSAF
ncbi:hypothetical protein X559_1158 [Paenilisteria newyorkensis]|nr:hypothetical protein X559_1158 [Listeria newyorkensis]